LLTGAPDGLVSYETECAVITIQTDVGCIKKAAGLWAYGSEELIALAQPSINELVDVAVAIIGA
jgi:hypothetical protein